MAITNVENLRQFKSRFSLIIELILAVNSSPSMVRKVTNMSPNFKQIALRCFMVLNILIDIVKLISSLKSNSSTKYYTQIAHTRHSPFFPGILFLFW